MGQNAEAKFLKQERASIERYLSPELKAEADAQQDELARLVAQPPRAEIGRKIPSLTLSLELWFQGLGLFKLFEGDETGWQDLRDVLFCQQWCGRVLETAYQRSTDANRLRPDLTSQAFSDALLALHLGDVDSARALMARLVAQSQEGTAQQRELGPETFTFEARLYELISSEKLALRWEGLRPLEKYQALLACDETNYREALALGCSEHLEQTFRSKTRLIVAFAGGIYRAIPIELMAWRSWRRSLGQEHGSEGHPLLESKLASLDPPPPSLQPSPLRVLVTDCIPHIRAYLDA